jgi:hypothetical protein
MLARTMSCLVLSKTPWYSSQPRRVLGEEGVCFIVYTPIGFVMLAEQYQFTDHKNLYLLIVHQYPRFWTGKFRVWIVR